MCRRGGMSAQAVRPLTEGMGVAMTSGARAAHFVGGQLRLHGLMIWHRTPNMGRRRMALTAIGIVVRFRDVDLFSRLFRRHAAITAEVVIIDVLHSAHFSEGVAEHAVVGVADVAAFVAEKRVSRVTSS